MENNKTPSIRFKGFTDPWEQRKLCDVVKEITRNDPESEAPIMMITANNGFIEQSERYAFNNAGESLKKYILLKKGELAYNHGASKLRPYGSCFALTTAENARIPFVYHCFSAENQNAEFMSIELNGDEIENQLRKIVSSGARMDGLLNISFDEYTSVSVLLPGIEEQDCIADFFRQLDHLITLHQRKYDKLLNIKKSMLEKMFPKNGSNIPKIRFKGFTDPWEQRKWIDVVDISTEMVNPTTGAYDNMPHIAPGNIESFTGRILDNVKTVKEEQLISGKFRFRPDDVVYGKINPQLGKYFYATVNGLTSADAYVFNGKNGLNQKFLFSLIQTSDFFNYSVSVSKRSGMPKINRDELNAYSFYMPSEEEQEKIGSSLLQLDNLITLHQRELEKLQNIKKSMLEKMFV